MARSFEPGVLEVCLLGPLEVRRDGRLLELGGAKPRQLLADLLLALGEAVSVDRLVDDVWGERPPARAAHAVQVYVSQLRKELGNALITRAPGYAVVLDPQQVDVHRFERRAAEGRALLERDPDDAASVLREALGLWRGRAFADFAFEPFAQVEITRLEELRQECLEDRIEADLAAGRHADLVPELEALVRAEPRRERLRAQQMLALYRSGRAPEALAAYRETREALVGELGIEPGRELRELERAILRQDASVLDMAAGAHRSDEVRRRIATVVAVELVEPVGEPDPEDLHRLVSRWHERCDDAVRRHGGRIESIDAASVAAVFGVPLVREDDAFRAVRAALELRSVDARIGVETGEVAAGGSLVAGSALGHAKSLAARATPDAVLLGANTASLVAHAARFEPGTTELLELAEDAALFERRTDVALVGRGRELDRLREAFEETVRLGECRAVKVVGPPGIGKTRLAQELLGLVGERALVLSGVCLLQEVGSTYGPLGRVVRDAPRAEGLEPSAAATLTDAFARGRRIPTAPEVAWAFRRLCEALAADRPLVLLLDDLQWAEPTLLVLIEQLAARGGGPILVLCLARDDLDEEHPTFLERAGRLALEGLAPEEISALVQQLLGPRPSLEDLLARVVESAEGNPLFLEQLLGFIVEEGALVARPFPPTIQALLAARLDRLGPGERRVLGAAAVVGREFATAELEPLLGPDGAATVERHLRRLGTRGFVDPVAGGYRFRHLLVQEAVYRATSKAERAALHERLADHLDGAAEPDERIGFHLEQAHALSAELGIDDRRVRQLATDAGTRLGAAGILAWKRNDVHATVGLLERATALLPDDASLARELTCELGLALLAGGDARRAVDALDLAARAASSVGDAHIELRARMERAFVDRLEQPSASGEELLAVVRAAIPTFEALHDDRAAARAWLLAGYVQGGTHLRCKDWEDSSERALAAYGRLGWPAATCLGQLAQALYRGPTPAPEAVARCTRLLDDAGGPAGEANVLVFLGGLRAMQGELDEGRALAARARAIFDGLGQLGPLAALCGEVDAAVEVLAGDWPAAERALRESCEALRDARLTVTFATRAGELAAALYAQGIYDQAEEWTQAAEIASATDDLDARLAWEPVRAKLLARGGDLGRAEAAACGAVRVARGTDALNRRAQVLLDCAEVLRLGGKEEDADGLVEEARRDYELKGNVVGAASALASASA